MVVWHRICKKNKQKLLPIKLKKYFYYGTIY